MSIKKDLNHERTVETIVGRYEQWKDARRSKEQIWMECLNNYMVHIDEAAFDGWPWRCKVADTFSQETADVIGSAMRNALFPTNEEFFEIEGEDELGVQYSAAFYDYMQKLLHRMKFIERIGTWGKQLAVIGNSPVLLTWEMLELSRRRRIRETNTQSGDVKYVVKDERRKSYDGPGVTVLDAFDVVFDPSLMDPRQATYIRRVELDKDLVKAMYKGVDLSALDTEAQGKPTEPSDTFKVQRAKIFGVDVSGPITKSESDKNKVEVLELHGEVLVDGERHTDILGAVLNRKVLARFDRNEYWGGKTILWGTYDPLWFTGFAKGPLEPVRGTQQLIDTFSCQKVDVLNVITNGCFAYVDDGIIDPETLYLRPRGGIEVGNIANIKEMHPNTNISLTYQEIEFLRARGERSTGKSSFDKGQAPGGRRTAYEASLIRQGGGARDIDIVKHLANDFMEPVLEWMMVSIQQFKWDSGELGPKTNDILLGQYHVNYLGADLTALRQFETQQLMLFLDMAGRYPALAEAVDAPTLVEEASRLFHFRRPVVKSRVQYEREQRQKQLLAMQQQAQQQGGGPTSMEGQMGTSEPAPVDDEQAMALAGEGA